MEIFDKPSSIRNIDISVTDNVISYEAFFYEMTHIHNGKKYTGYHPDVFDGTYWGSPTDEEFKRILNGEEELIDYKITKVGLLADIKNFESKTQSEAKVKSNPDYYNKAVAPSANKLLIQKKTCLEVRDIINDKIKRGEYELEDIKEIAKLDRLQVRSEEDIKHIQKIKDRAKRTGIKNTEPIIIWEGATYTITHDDGTEEVRTGDVIGDGNHTLRALCQLSNILQAKVIRMDYPFQEDLKLSELDLRYIGNLKNPKQKKIEKENEPEDMVKLLLRCKQQGQELDPKKTNHARDLLEPFGYDARERSLIVKKVNEEFANSIYKKANQKIAVYSQKTHPENWKKLLDRKKEIEQNENTIVIYRISNSWSKMMTDIIEEMKKPENKHKFQIHVLFYHNNQKNQDDWGRTYREQFTSQLDWLLDNMEPVTTKTGVKVKRRKQTEEMKHLISDVS